MSNEIVEYTFKPITSGVVAGIGVSTILNYRADYSLYFGASVVGGMLLANIINDMAWRDSDDKALKTFSYKTSELGGGAIGSVVIDRLATGNSANLGLKGLIALGSIMVADYANSSVYNTGV